MQNQVRIHRCKWSNYDFWISQGSVAIVSGTSLGGGTLAPAKGPVPKGAPR